MSNQTIFAKQILTPDGWQSDRHVEIGGNGRIETIGMGDISGARNVDVLAPAIGNLHSHSFQRAMAGLTEYRGSNQQDDFWSWRQLMYRFLDALTPDDIEAIAAQVQMEMLEAGYASVGEFHYLHHQPDGAPFDQPAELSLRLFEAAAVSGIGLTHLPVLYMRGGLDNRALVGGQVRFGCDIEKFEHIVESLRSRLLDYPDDFCVGVAPHSLRAVSKDGIEAAMQLAPSGPIHIHIAEQTAEVDEVVAAYGARPVRWLLDNADVDARWCLVHATHMDAQEISDLAATKAVAGLCPITEANLGDGVFAATDFIAAGGEFGVGSDSNIRIALAEELRLLEYSQRLRDRRRTLLADQTQSCGRFLYEHALRGGAKALARDSGRIAVGAVADLVALDGHDAALLGLTGDQILDAWIFAADDRVVTDVWAAGRHVVEAGRHIRRDEIAPRFETVIKRLRSEL